MKAWFTMIRPSNVNIERASPIPFLPSGLTPRKQLSIFSGYIQSLFQRFIIPQMRSHEAFPEFPMIWNRKMEQFGGFDHRVCLAAPLSVPDKAAPPRLIVGASDDALDGRHLMLGHDVFLKLFFLFRKDDIVLKKPQQIDQLTIAVNVGMNMAGSQQDPARCNIPDRRCLLAQREHVLISECHLPWLFSVEHYRKTLERDVENRSLFFPEKMAGYHCCRCMLLTVAIAP
jgi:hypothetical protein